MKQLQYKFRQSITDMFFDAGFGQLKKLVDQKTAIIITDENVFRLHTSKFEKWNVIVLKAGEEYKVQATVDAVIEQLIEMQADRNAFLIGVGGGVITDLTGYIASIYMRGVRFGFVPTTLLAMVDASIGGKNGIDVGVYKNMVGNIRQPGFILFDVTFLSSLPDSEWRSGFAEIIKHAAIMDATMFRELENNDVEVYKSKKNLVSALIQRNARLKSKVVLNDEFEKGERKLLNFGHTLGHALENQYQLSHGQAISIGMTYASVFSEQLNGFRQSQRIVKLLEKYGLPTYAAFDKQKVIDVLAMDKKRERKTINYILLERVGKAVIRPVPIKEVNKMIASL